MWRVWLQNQLNSLYYWRKIVSKVKIFCLEKFSDIWHYKKLLYYSHELLLINLNYNTSYEEHFCNELESRIRHLANFGTKLFMSCMYRKSSFELHFLSRFNLNCVQRENTIHSPFHSSSMSFSPWNIIKRVQPQTRVDNRQHNLHTSFNFHN
jgi:hypothetical protein